VDDVSNTPNIPSSEASKIYDGYLIYKTHRRKTWEKIAEKSLKFYFGEQWSAEDKAYLEQQKRAPAVFNMCLPAINLIVGHQTNNRIDFVASPVDRYADVKLADVLTDTIKHVENVNNNTFERQFQFIDGMITGVGVIEKWFDTETTIEGEIRSRQKSAWHYYLDPNFEKYDYSDARKLYKEIWMSKDDVKRIYGNKVANQITVPTEDESSEYPTNNVNPSWSDNPSSDYGNQDSGIYPDMMFQMGFDTKKNLIRVIEEYEKVWDEVDIYATLNGGIMREDEMADEDKEDAVLIKTMYIPHIHLKALIGNQVIGENTALKNREFSELFNLFFPYFVNGRFMGVMENAFYPQEELNKVHSSLIHILNTVAHAGMHYKEGAMNPEYEADIENLMGQPSPIIKWDEMYDEQGRPNWQMIDPQEPPQSYFTIMGSAGERLKYITGAVDAMTGTETHAQSGKAKTSDIQQASVTLAGMIENFRETQRLSAKAELWWIQNYYDTERFVRIRGDNPNQQQQNGYYILNEQIYSQIANDITIGEYDIILRMEGKTQTERDRMFWKYTEMGRMLGPQYAPVFARLALESSDIPEKDDIVNEIKMIQQQQMQMQQMSAVKQIQPRGAVQSAARPNRGERREPATVRQPAINPY